MAPSAVPDEHAAQATLEPPAPGGRPLPVVVPNRWLGEADCLVGPFSGRDVAAYFANRLVDFGQYEVFSMRVFARRNAWYVEVRTRTSGRRVDRRTG